MSKTVNTILTITVIISMAFLLFYGYCATQKLDEAKEAKVVSTISKHINYREAAPANPEFIEDSNPNTPPEDENFEAFFEEEDDDYYEEPVQETIIEKVEPPIVKTPEAKKIDTPFLVIAGSFQSRGNAENKVKELKSKGVDAEIVHLHNSKLHAICIARSSTEKQANDTMSLLKANRNIKAYVYKIP